MASHSYYCRSARGTSEPRKLIGKLCLRSSSWKATLVSLLQIKNASISLGIYLDWSLYGILFNGEIRGRRTIHLFPSRENLTDRPMNSNREIYRSTFGIRDQKRRLPILSCLGEVHSVKPSAFRILVAKSNYQSWPCHERVFTTHLWISKAKENQSRWWSGCFTKEAIMRSLECGMRAPLPRRENLPK